MKHVRIEDDLYKELRSKAFQNEKSLTKYINELLKKAIKKEI